jgi:hypothetical protein
VYVCAIHTIRDRGRWEEMMRGFDPSTLPAGTDLIATATSIDVDRAICLWQAPDVPGLQAILDDLAGEFAVNDLFPASDEFTMVAPPQARQSATV